jgi:quinol monooxygenase YgiN
MIVVVGRAVTDDARREDFIRIAQAVARASRAEQGCRGYRIYEDTELANEFVFIEEWDSQEALETHFRTSHIAEFMQSFPAAVAGAPDVKFHTIASTVDLADVSAPR